MPARTLVTAPLPPPSFVTDNCTACADTAAPKVSNKTASRTDEDEKHRFAQETIKPDFIV
jgi:hypothetical protein